MGIIDVEFIKNWAALRAYGEFKWNYFIWVG
jgi:hypothetical protein